MTRQPVGAHNTLHYFGGQDPGVDQWIYVLPLAPASTPSDYLASPLSPSYENSWTNISGQQALRFGITLGLHVVIQGATDGGALGTVVFTLPVGYRPLKPTPILFPSLAGASAYTGLIATDGTVTILGLIAGDGASGVSYGGYDIVDTNPGPPLPNVFYPINQWTPEAGIPLLDLSDPDNAAVLLDGLYTWNVLARLVSFGAPVGAFPGYQVQVGWQLSTVGSPLFSQLQMAFPVTKLSSDDPQSSGVITLPMRAGDTLEAPYWIHNVPVIDPDYGDIVGLDVNLQLVRQVISGAFPVI